MSAATLVAGAALDLTTLALYLHAGRLILRRARASPGQALQGFALFWYAVAVVNALNAVLLLLAAAGAATLPVAFGLWDTRIALALIGFAGLVYYLLYLYVGRAGLRYVVALAYLGIFLLMQVWLIQSRPVAADVQEWWVGLEHANPAKTPLYYAIVILFFIPPLVSAIAYAFIVRHVHDPAQRRRGRLTAIALAAYFAGLTFGYLDPSVAWWGLAENILGIGAGLVVIAANHDPVHTPDGRPADGSDAALRQP